MIFLTRTPLRGIELLVKDAFQSDDKLRGYHVHDGTMEDCIKDTIAKIYECAEQMPLQCYSVNSTKDKKTIGYLVISKEYRILYSFGIRKEFRDKENTAAFFQLIVGLMNTFKCYLWNKNVRAIRFLENSGMEIQEINDTYTILTYKED